MFKILIRFNTAHNGNGLLWRVLINEKEFLASEVQAMHTGFKTSTNEVEDGAGNKVMKQHISILTANEPIWNGTTIFIS